MTKEKFRCPSSYPEGIDANVFAVVVGSVNEPEVKYLKQPIDVTDELLASTAPASPTEVFRFSSQCIEKKCWHFNADTEKCTLAERTIEFSNPKLTNLAACAIRKTCVWWNQHGKAVCVRCSQVVRDGYPVTNNNIYATTPPEFLNSK